MTVKEQSQVVTSLAKDNFIPGHFRIVEGETGLLPPSLLLFQVIANKPPLAQMRRLVPWTREMS